MAVPRQSLDSDEIVSEIRIAAPCERIFQALVDPQQVVQWWGQAGIYRCTKFESDLRVGGAWRSIGVDGTGREFEITGEYLEVDPPRLLSSTWLATWTGKVETKIRWELEPTKKGTLVRIRHSGFAAHPEIAQAYRGWPRMLGWLQSLLERGETVEQRPSMSAQSNSAGEQKPVVGFWGVRYQVADVSRSVVFYTERLGFKLDQQNLPAFAQVSIGNLKLILSGPGASGSRPMPDGRKQGPGGWNRMLLQVQDLPAHIDAMKKAGLHFRNEMEVGPGGKQIQLEDPDGNPIELFEPARR